MPKSSLSIMIAEDNANDAFLIKKAFDNLGVKGSIHVVTGGVEAIAYLEGEGEFSNRDLYPYPNCLITDLKMPGLDGFAVLEHVKKNPGRSIPAVVLSSSSDTDDIRQAYALGASSYHVKPTRLEDLILLLRTLYNYWILCEVPTVDSTGRHLPTDSRGKLGERFDAH